METPEKIYIRAVSEKQKRFVAYSELYEQDEQDIEYIRSDLAKLKWEDIQILDHFVLQLVNEERNGENDWGDGEQFYKEVLLRFNEYKFTK